MRIPYAVLFVFLAFFLPFDASTRSEDLFGAINSIRAEGCAGQEDPKQPLRRDASLDQVAQALASGRRLREAMKESDYRAARSASLEVSGSEAAVVAALDQRGCRDIGDPGFRDIGIFERGDSTWIVLAAPWVPPSEREAEAIDRRVLDLVNEARAEPRRCGRKRFERAPPLERSDALRAVALAHARDMAERGALSHTGRDGSTSAERATRAGYRWRAVGENIASGQTTPEQVVAEWMRSPRHCGNVMSPDYSETGVAFAVEPQGGAAVYWAQVFAAPRPES